jgi:Mrp family chromosome partitioning ATPase
MALTRMAASKFDDPFDAGRRQTMIIAAVVITMATLVLIAPASYAIGIVAFAAVGVGAYFAWGAYNAHRGLHTAAEAAKRVGMPALGVVQQLSSHTLREVSPDQRTPYGYVLEKPESAFAGVFRHALSFPNRGGTRRGAIAVTSPYRYEGATTISLCLARTEAAAGKSVVLVDCDLRKRTLTRTLGLSPRQGVWEAIGAPDYSRMIQLDPDSHVKILPAGNESGPFRDLFSKRGFFDLVRALRKQYDCVILDCPAALLSVDARMIVGGADSVVLVVAHAKTPASAIKHAQRQLNIGGNRPAGIIINKAPRSRDLVSIGQTAVKGDW